MGTSAELPPPPTRNTGCGAGDLDAKGDLEGRAWAEAAGDLAGKGDFAVGVGATLLAGAGVAALAAGVLGLDGVTWGSLTGGRAGDFTAAARA